jgi:hypothetical protein
LGTGGAPLACDPRGSHALWPRVTRLEKGFRWREMLTIFAFQRRDSPMASLMTALARARTRCALEWMRTAASVLSMVNVEGDGAQWPWRVGSTSVITAAIVSARVDAHWGSTPACDFTYDGVTTSCCRSQRDGDVGCCEHNWCRCRRAHCSGRAPASSFAAAAVQNRR